jgi:3D (Asp-Asp-Asp) domain-containing protein
MSPVRRASLLLVFVAACGGGGGGGAPDGGTHDATAADAADPGASLGSFELTYYWVTAEDDFTGAQDTAIYTDACDTLATVRSPFADSLDIEGTGRLSDGRIINVSGGCGCPRSPCYAEVDTDHPWGYGVQGRALVPFHSIAVDPAVIPYGTGIYLADFDGVEIDDEILDGCVIAADTGGDIIGQHIDFFAALRTNYFALDAELGLTQIDVRDGGDRCPDDP